MDYRDRYGLLVDETKDGGDSAHFAGLAAIFGSCEPLDEYEVFDGILARHPYDYPQNNYNNFTADQLCPLVAGLHTQKQLDVSKRVFWSHAKRGFFCQNIDRDMVGSRKSILPHEFYKDSIPNQTTFIKKLKFSPLRFESDIERKPKTIIESRVSDFRDLLGPSEIWHLILCAEIKWLYWFGLIGYPALLVSLLYSVYFNHSNDEGRLISKIVRAGKPFILIYTKLKPNWKNALLSYWIIERKMNRMFGLIANGLNNLSR